MAGYGGTIVYCAPTLTAREATLERVVHETGATFIHPYNDTRVIAGQGTAALELLTDVADLDVIMAPVGGGGLLSGTAIVTAALSPSTRSSQRNQKPQTTRIVPCRRGKFCWPTTRAPLQMGSAPHSAP